MYQFIFIRKSCIYIIIKEKDILKEINIKNLSCDLKTISIRLFDISYFGQKIDDEVFIVLGFYNFKINTNHIEKNSYYNFEKSDNFDEDELCGSLLYYNILLVVNYIYNNTKIFGLYNYKYSIDFFLCVDEKRFIERIGYDNIYERHISEKINSWIVYKENIINKKKNYILYDEFDFYCIEDEIDDIEVCDSREVLIGTFKAEIL